MNISTASTGFHEPLPDGQFKRFITVFHIIFIGGLICSLVLRWRRPEFAWAWRDTVLLTLVLVQSGLYLLFFGYGAKMKHSWKSWGFYALAAVGIWLVEWRLESNFEWAIGAILGQLFGALPPKASLPISAAIFVVYFGFKIGWERLGSLSPWQWLAGLAIVGAWTALGLFIHRLTTTSSERARLIQQLEAAQKELQLARQSDAELAALRERERLARELHDSLGHGLVTLTVQLEAAHRLWTKDPEKASALIEEMKKLTRTSMGQLRCSLDGLRSPGLGEVPLSLALNKCCEEVAGRRKIKVDCKTEADIDRLPPPIVEALWRVVQEGLLNIEKHSHATMSQVSLVFDSSEPDRGSQNPNAGNNAPASVREAREVVLRICDDGVGLSPEAEAKPGHYGLRGIRERVEGLGGVLKISSAKPNGTAIEARIPMMN